MKYPDKSCCVIDFGLYAELCVTMAKDFGKVYFYNPSWRTVYPTNKNVTIGLGLKNVTVITDFYNYKDNIDFFIFPDVFCGDIAEDLYKQNKTVWGSRNSEWMELKRWKMLGWMKKNGMSVPTSREFIGIDELEKNIEEGWIIKIDKYRGDIETFPFYSKATHKEYFKYLRLKFCERSNDISFMAQEPIEGLEIGYDGWNINGEYPVAQLWGYEVKDSSYVGKFCLYNELPKQLKDINEKLKIIFTEEEYKGSFSSEVRCKKTGKNYLIDPCCRLGYPPHQVQLAMISNLAECFYEGAKGNIVIPKPKAKFGAMVLMNSEFAEQNEYCITFPEEIRDFVKIKNVAYLHGNYYSIPDNKTDDIGAVVGLGSTLEKAVENCKKNAELVKGLRLKIDVSTLDEAAEKIRESKEYGIIF